MLDKTSVNVTSSEFNYLYCLGPLPQKNMNQTWAFQKLTILCYVHIVLYTPLA